MSVKSNYNFSPDISGISEQNGQINGSEQGKPQKRSEGSSFFSQLNNFFCNGNTRLVAGVAFVAFGIYLLISFLSFSFVSGASDQNRVENYALMQNAMSPDAIKNQGGALGADLSQFIVGQLGYAAIIIVIWFIVIGIRYVNRQKRVMFFSFTFTALYTLICSVLVLGFIFSFPIFESFSVFPPEGNVGKFVNLFIYGLVGLYGQIAFIAFVVLIWVLLFGNSVKTIYQGIATSAKQLRKPRTDEYHVPTEPSGMSEFAGHQKMEPAQQPTVKSKPVIESNRAQKTNNPVVKKEETPLPQPAHNTEAAVMKPIDQAQKFTNPHDPTGEYLHYRFPTLDLLQDIEVKLNNVDIEEQDANKLRITETLNNYGIKIKNIEVHVGPTVTLFEIIPEDGVRISRIRGLEDDIALSLAALGIRIIAPMPGRGTIGIEVPNRDPQVVPIKGVLGSEKFQTGLKNRKWKLPMVLGCTVSNEVFIGDLTKMPHLLVAGATGQGKSVGLNTIITSLLYTKGPSELKFVLVDPKKVEFSLYAGIENYFFAKIPGDDKAIVTDKDKVVLTLNALVQEMENRYHILETVHERKIEDYNARWHRELKNQFDDQGNPYEFMPYIVVIIDEFSDLIMDGGKQVETPIVRIAQKARAIGIHMIIATQRPSAQVITGLIKANFPGRIAFRVTGAMDSRIIIDRKGADRLIGRGDMLFAANGEITRLQCPFVDTPDIVNLCSFIEEQCLADRNVNHQEAFLLPEGLIGEGDNNSAGGASRGGVGAGERDPLFDDAVRMIVSGDMASTSSLQRHFQIGYNRAGRIMDQMEAAGIVGPSVGGKPRKVLIDALQLDDYLNN